MTSAQGSCSCSFVSFGFLCCYLKARFVCKMPPPTVTLTCLVALLYFAGTSQSKTVVLIPYPSISHAHYLTNVARAVGRRGHQVSVALPTSLLEKRYLNVSGFHTVPYETVSGIEESTMKLFSDRYFEGKPEKVYEFLLLCRDMLDNMLKNSSFINAIKQLSPDLIVIDNFPMFYAISVIPYKLGLPFAFVGPSYIPPLMRIPFTPADVPWILLPFSNNMTFVQRLQNTLTYMLFVLDNPSFPINAVSKYAPDMEYLPLDLLVTRAEIFLVEIDHILDYPKPTLPNVKLIGGTATGPAKALPPEFQSFMDGAKEGVVIVSFGSFVLHLPQHISDKIFQVLLQLPMKSVFRSNLKSPDPSKILTSSWIPQNDLLGHPHTKVFVSHCGSSGQYEALYHAVPMVATPIFVDQWYNAERVRIKGLAEVLDLKTCTAEQMKSAILTVANEPRYKQAIVKRSRLFRELYGVPMETAAYWLEHVMEYGGDYMRSAGQQMPLYQFLLLDVFLFILFVLVLSVVLICVFITLIYRWLCKKKQKSD